MADESAVVDAPDAEEARPEQTVKVEDAGPALKRLTIELPESRIKGKIEDTYTNLSNDAVLPGFRKGRAPRRLLEKRFAESIQGDVKNQLLSESYHQALEDEGLDVIGEPDVKDIDELEVPESGSLTYTVEVEVTPDFELPKFDGIKVEKKTFDVTDADVDAEIEQYRERYGQMSAVEDATVAEGDYVQSDVKVLAGENAGDDAEVVHEHPAAYTLVHGEDKEFKGHVAGILVDDMGKQLAGKKVGDTVSISMTGPEGHENEGIKGQPITLVMALTHVHRLEPAAVEDLLPQFGMQTEDELKERVKTMLEQRNEQTQQADMHKQATEQIVEAVELDLPEGLKGRQIERTLQRQQMELLYSGKQPEEIEEELAEARTQGEAEAVRQLKTFFVLDKAAKELEVEVTENEINGRIAMMAMQQQRRPEKLRNEMRQRGELEQLYLSIREQKTLDKIIEQASVTEVEAKDGE
ncbi:trigger factor [Algisphaera agarilytica]|uniref:Trigger factor n=1 Tax=Algisphaera agarilytica TaxID=1385975 RepID=A0A7X0LLT8_9BACT|nr:trigger factor [Algisphaera agarilytica]MBB6430966.1 trigger factor [Algisphaera agarilytica]